MSNQTVIVTGGAGMIGSNVARKLVDIGYDVIIVDDLRDGRKLENIKDIKFYDYLDKDEFVNILKNKSYNKPIYKKIKKSKAIVHNGAISFTTASDADEIIKLNYSYSKQLYYFCKKHKIQLVYASSASVYGKNKKTEEIEENENPLNLYAFSKLLFDNFIRKETKKFTKNKNQIVGLRYFNCYGPGEKHKDDQFSPFYRYFSSIQNTGKLELISGDDGSGLDATMHSRDFVYTDDVVNVICWFLINKKISGIFNVGSGTSTTFKEVSEICLNQLGKTKEDVLFKQFPEKLKGKCQQYTLANINLLRSVGYDKPMTSVKDGCKKYYDIMGNEK